MIAGLGNDLCDTRRIARAVDRHGERFPRRILGSEEWQVFAARRTRHATRALRYLATRFAAKEAFSKAIGLGLHSPMRWRDCQILNAASGQPLVVLSGALRLWFAQHYGERAEILVSLADDGDWALATVVVAAA